jgi:hypothetical protein
MTPPPQLFFPFAVKFYTPSQAYRDYLPST